MFIFCSFLVKTSWTHFSMYFSHLHIRSRQNIMLKNFLQKLFQYSFRVNNMRSWYWLIFFNHSQIMDIMGGNFSRNSQISIIIYPNEQEVFQEEECLGTIHTLRDHFLGKRGFGVIHNRRRPIFFDLLPPPSP